MNKKPLKKGSNKLIDSLICHLIGQSGKPGVRHSTLTQLPRKNGKKMVDWLVYVTGYEFSRGETTEQGAKERKEE